MVPDGDGGLSSAPCREPATAWWLRKPARAPVADPKLGQHSLQRYPGLVPTVLPRNFAPILQPVPTSTSDARLY